MTATYSPLPTPGAQHHAASPEFMGDNPNTALTRDNLLENNRRYSSPNSHGRSIAQKKRKYSADLYQYTEKMCENIREDIDRRKQMEAHQGSAESTFTIDSKSTSTNFEDQDPIHARMASEDSLANDIGAVPALH